jgi:hypothetical protein
MVSRERDHKVIEPRGIVQHQAFALSFPLRLQLREATFSMQLSALRSAIRCTFGASRTK